ncbi:MAG: hypothetical protein ACXWUG_16390 [Polyangiales bacterium]
MRFLPLALAAATFAIPAAAHAENAGPAPTAADDEPVHHVSLTFSPIHLLMPIFEVTGEVAVTNKIGVAAIVGAGSVPVKTTTTTVGASSIQTAETTEHYSAWEVGGHFNYYVIGNFDHGMQLGVEGMYVHVATSNSDVRAVGTASGFAIGPYAGYKIATRIGFTFEGNLGVQYVAARANATSGSQTATASGSSVIPLVNLNIGWSF